MGWLVSVYRTVLEQKIKERRQSVEEFAEFVETFAREHGEPGTLSTRNLQRLLSGHRADGAPLGPVRTVTARLLERIFGLDIDVLLSPPRDALGTADIAGGTASPRTVHVPETVMTRPAPGNFGAVAADLSAAFDWLDTQARWTPQTTQIRVTERLAELGVRTAIAGRLPARVGRGALAEAMAAYYDRSVPGHGFYRTRIDGHGIDTTVFTRPSWLDLRCPLTPSTDLLRLDAVMPGAAREHDAPYYAVDRLAEAVTAGVRVSDRPVYRLLSADVEPARIGGSVGLASFVEYALTLDLLESELSDAVSRSVTPCHGSQPLRDRYLPSLAAVLDLDSRLCVGGALALCAIARPADPFRGPADYALLVQERSTQVVNAARRLAVIPKGFHQPLRDYRADTRIGATLRRELEEELFGHSEVDSTEDGNRVADPMHPNRLSAPMHWLSEEPGRLRMECTGFGLNTISGNYEFASLLMIDDERFWTRFGGDIEANWESRSLRQYSSLDRDLVTVLAADESWSNEGLFAFAQGLRRLREIGGERVDLPQIDVLPV
ncbi:hypothetical protein AHOG_14605 [Actinoalloteichus hoggarensis]|uniref:Uncharacterized protein n=1 Tax=Actinoalloteichus hoggarensis TaxID=1470176 RepID=A0A221W3W9_9PSEU|nr:hypothetical protein AHOG_14605 [Actinoalloteichus hoggarensis]